MVEVVWDLEGVFEVVSADWEGNSHVVTDIIFDG